MITTRRSPLVFLALKVNAWLFTIVCALFLVSCAKNDSLSTSEDTLSRIQKTGEIDACTVVYPPYGMKDSKTGKLSGVCIDMLELIAQKINAKVVWHETTFGDAAADLQSKRCDVMAMYFNSNIPRAETVAFTLPAVMYIGESGIIRKDDDRFLKIKDIYEFDKPDITVVVATGEAGDIFVKENFHKAKIKRIDVESSDITRFALEVSAKRADIGIADAGTIALYASQHPEVVDLFKDNPFSPNPASWAVRQDDYRWLHFLETSLQFLDTQGTLTELEKKYNAHPLHLVKEYKLQ